MLLTGLLIIPFGLFIVKFINFSNYRSIKLDAFGISDSELSSYNLFFDILLVYDKITVCLECVVINANDILILTNATKIKSNDIEKLFSLKGYDVKCILVNNPKVFMQMASDYLTIETNYQLLDVLLQNSL